jgi:RHH-type rel operon transcriptional repressor/antitoxin RelB
MSGSSVLTLRHSPKLKEAIGPVVAFDESQPLIWAAQAIRECVSLNDWQIAEIKKGIAEADRGDFASDKEVERTVKKWTSRAG